MWWWVMVGCAGGGPDAVEQVKDFVQGELDGLASSAEALRDAAPADAWDASDPDAMRGPWKDARVRYERVEGAIAVLFPDLDASTDERYDGFLADGPDDDPFDGEGVTGIHAIERILWAGEHPAQVVAFESALPGYTEAAWPADAAEAARFRDGLCGRLVDDTAALRDGFSPLALDRSTAFRGVIGSMLEQHEKVGLAGTGEDESRYAGHTLADMRANLDGGRSVFDAFRDEIRALSDGEALEAEIDAGFDRLVAAYDAIPGDGVPAVPETWNPEDPAAPDLETPYGALWSAVSAEADPDAAGSLVERLSAAADQLGIPQLPE